MITVQRIWADSKFKVQPTLKAQTIKLQKCREAEESPPTPRDWLHKTHLHALHIGRRCFSEKLKTSCNKEDTSEERNRQRGKHGVTVDGTWLRRGGGGCNSTCHNTAITKAREISDRLSRITSPQSPRRRHPLRRFPASRLVSDPPSISNYLQFIGFRARN